MPVAGNNPEPAPHPAWVRFYSALLDFEESLEEEDRGTSTETKATAGETVALIDHENALAGAFGGSDAIIASYSSSLPETRVNVNGPRPKPRPRRAA